LVVGNPISQIVLIPVSYAMAPYRPRIKLDHWREFINFSKWLLFGNICSLLDGQLMNIVIGRLEGMSAVGLYQLAYQIAALPVSEIAAPLRGPAYAGFARLQGKPPAMRWQFRATLEMQWMVILPLSVGIALTAHEITSLFLGAHWVGLTPIMPLVAGAALLDALGHFTHGLQIVLNSQRRMVLVWFATILVRVPLVALGTAQYGLVGAMVALVGTGLVNALVWLSQAGSLIGLSLPNCLAPLWRSSTAAAAMTGVVLFVPAHWFANSALLQDGFSLLIKAGAGAATYCGALAALWWLSGMPDRSAEAEILRLLHRLTHRLGLLSQR
jgi:lipopolysaccharide exporter